MRQNSKPMRSGLQGLFLISPMGRCISRPLAKKRIWKEFFSGVIPVRISQKFLRRHLKFQKTLLTIRIFRYDKPPCAKARGGLVWTEYSLRKRGGPPPPPLFFFFFFFKQKEEKKSNKQK